jgi:hypothetical protein
VTERVPKVVDSPGSVDALSSRGTGRKPEAEPSSAGAEPKAEPGSASAEPEAGPDSLEGAGVDGCTQPSAFPCRP